MFDVFPVDQIPGSAVSQGVAVPVIGKKQPVDALSIFQDIRITDNVPKRTKIQNRPVLIAVLKMEQIFPFCNAQCLILIKK